LALLETSKPMKLNRSQEFLPINTQAEFACGD
jgi:hypothetical protein